jgi:hypothetical protein
MATQHALHFRAKLGKTVMTNSSLLLSLQHAATDTDP